MLRFYFNLEVITTFGKQLKSEIINYSILNLIKHELVTKSFNLCDIIYKTSPVIINKIHTHLNGDVRWLYDSGGV